MIDIKSIVDIWQPHIIILFMRLIFNIIHVVLQIPMLHFVVLPNQRIRRVFNLSRLNVFW